MLFLYVFIVVVLSLLYTKLKYFTLRGPIPGISPQFLIGNLYQTGLLFRNASIPLTLEKLKNRFGDIFQFWLGPSRLIVLFGLEDIQHVFSNRHIYDQGDLFVHKFGLLFPDGLICTRGATYKRHASITVPIFRRAKLISNLPIIIDCTDKFLDRWRADPTPRVHVNINEQCHELLLAIFGFIGFDYDLGTLNSESDAGQNELTLALRDFLSAFQLTIQLPNFIGAMYLKLSSRYRQAHATIQRYLYQMMEQEMAQSKEIIEQRKRTCLIASLVGSLQEDEAMEAKKRDEDKKGLSRTELLHEMLLFLVSGFETVSTSLAWFIHLISKHPRVQQKIKIELMDSGNNQDLTLERLDSLVYLDAVINEVLRFAPPAIGTNRTLMVDDRLPQSGTQLYKGDQVHISFYSLAHDPRYWSIDPELFYPERFLAEDKNHQSYAYIPFGGGHRQCIGQDLARLELKAIIARLMQNVTFGDGGPVLNAGGHFENITTQPHHVGVTIEFDH